MTDISRRSLAAGAGLLAGVISAQTSAQQLASANAPSKNRM